MDERRGRGGLGRPVSFARYDVVIVPFPFTDRPVIRRRPALVLSDAAWNAASGHVVCAMITSAERSRWEGDLELRDLAAAGLRAECVVRMKLFTLEAGLVVRQAGALGEADRAGVAEVVARVLA